MDLEDLINRSLPIRAYIQRLGSVSRRYVCKDFITPFQLYSKYNVIPPGVTFEAIADNNSSTAYPYTQYTDKRYAEIENNYWESLKNCISNLKNLERNGKTRENESFMKYVFSPNS